MAKKIAIIGSGNWGSAIARIVGNNVLQFSGRFDPTVSMYVYEEMIDGRKLTEIINTDHENTKYLPGYKIPENVLAIPDIQKVCEDADIFLFIVPHQFLCHICNSMKSYVKKSAIGVTFIKGLDMSTGKLRLISSAITEYLSIPCYPLMGANLAPEVAAGQFCEATIGCEDVSVGDMLKNLLETNYFRLTVADDAATVELCGALKNVVALGAGFSDGLDCGDNTKAAVIRLGLIEMVDFCQLFFEGSKLRTLFESCGIADLVTTCYGGRNRRIAEQVVRTGKEIFTLEKELLNGQSLQGPIVAKEIHEYLVAKNLVESYPLFNTIYMIVQGEIKPDTFIDCLKNHPKQK